MNDKWEGSGYSPEKAWKQVQQEEWERQNPGNWYDGWIALGGVLALVGTVVCLCLFVLGLP